LKFTEEVIISTILWRLCCVDLFLVADLYSSF